MATPVIGPNDNPDRDRRNNAGTAAVVTGEPDDSYAEPLVTGSIILSNSTVPTSPTQGQIMFDGINFKGWNGTTWVTLG